ncbi:hypothetical protein AKJ09_04900 [Labilithrix luteola]|uniref:Tryptophan synthase alpha chain n=1 Tax=Labilithrix luteola TaxID=1391654 RepID=A0A0K1PXZ2_9BACT|nr:hypothetical protein [Labilithrix luteola]AKU98236.1 hypothetical protein AKJ09_04900 [Labilithrix luteola]
MRRFLLFLGIALVVGACTTITGADKFTIGDAIDDGTPGTSSNRDARAGQGGSDFDGSTVNDSGRPRGDSSTVDGHLEDSGVDASDGALPPPASDPNAVGPCGPPDGPRCDEGYACCATYPVTAPSCILRVYACNAGAGDTRVAHLLCDEKADCSGGQSCCFASSGGGSFSAKCLASCTVKMCRTDAECGGDKCILWPCAKGPVVATCNGDGFDSSLCY